MDIESALYGRIFYSGSITPTGGSPAQLILVGKISIIPLIIIKNLCLTRD